MAATRKLQGEIDRCLKKVSEGVETFDDIWQKVHNATNTNQKEKYETDLKKEIKKLQRLRDQIKSWIASAEIKDKSTLVDTRKLIETQMERFKVVERETKTKAYSKEGLGAAAKQDPLSRERDEISSWITNTIDELQIQIDSFEMEIESLTANKKKRLDKDKSDRLEDLKNQRERHQFHIQKLETLLRMLDNLADDISSVADLKNFLSQVKNIKEDLVYYLESNREPEFEENIYMYDDIDGLEEMEQQQILGTVPPPANNDAPGSPNTTGLVPPTSPIHSSSDGGGILLTNNSEEQSQEITNNNTTTTSEDSSKVIRPVAVKQGDAEVAAPKEAVPLSSPQKSLQGTPNNSSPSSGLSNHVSSLSSLSSSPTTQHQEKSSTVTEPSIFNDQFVEAVEEPPEPQPQHQHQPSEDLLPEEEVSLLDGIITTSTPTPAPVPISTSSAITSPSAPTTPTSVATINGSIGDEPHLANSSSTATASVQSVNDLLRYHQHEQMLDRLMQSDSGDSMATLKSMAQEAIDRARQSHTDNHEKKMIEAHIPPLLGVAPLGPVPLTKEHQLQFQMLESASYHMPLSSDSERMRQFLPRNPCPTPHYYPQNPLSNSDSLEFFQRLSIETLFFIFYYLEGTKAQYLAAKVLKKQSWRFHTKYMMWFQRHEEPKVINEEYEQGTYIYFDIEKWGQRKKDGFVFEYRYLEDRDLG